MMSYRSDHDLAGPPADLETTGRQLARRLLPGVDELPPDTLRRLSAAREQAVDRRRQMLTEQAQLAWRQSVAGPSGRGWFDQHAPAWHVLASVGTVLILALGLWMIDNLQSEQFVSETAEIDKLLLTDDLPTAAYLDPGFKHFLKLSFPSNSR